MRRRFFVLCIAVAIANLGVEAARAWEAAKGPLMTRWSSDVSPEKALPEYPRPQMVREKWTNLNGLWQYAIRPKAAEQPIRWDGEILVPFCVESALSGVKKAVKPEERLWYKRKFSSSALAGEKKLLLHFGAVDWACTVSVNGKEVGKHTGGYDPFTFDITAALKPGDAENELVVAVTDPTDTGTQPRGKQVLNPKGIFYTAVTGIWQTVWLEPVPVPYIESLKIVPDVDRGLVAVTVNATGGDKVKVKALDGKTTLVEKAGQPKQTIELKITNAKTWSPDDPHLYDLEVELSEGGKVVDSVDSYFGMRKIEVRKDDEGRNRLMLNNQALFQYGPLDQGWWPDGLYTAPTDAALKYDIEMTKKLGMNMARKHVKVEPARWYYWCDKLGLLVWQDMVSGDADKTTESKANYRRELKAMIDALQNAPSIVMWVPFNEGWGQYDTPEVAGWVKKYDPSRPVNEASGWDDKGSGDVSDMHSYPGPGMRAIEPNRVGVLGEFGGLGMPTKGHTWQAEKNWGYVSYENADALTNAYVDLLTMMRPLVGEGLSAAVYTQTTDVEVEVNGLMTYDRDRVKMAEARIAEAAKKLYQTPSKIAVVMPTSESEPQTWRYATSQPEADWMKVEFDDSRWNSGSGGFGTEATVGAVVRTQWTTPEIWLRKTFELKSLPEGGRFALRIHHREEADVYINGELAQSLKRHAREYQLSLLSSDAQRLLKAGKNTIAVHCRQGTAGQYIDAGLVEIVEQ